MSLRFMLYFLVFFFVFMDLLKVPISTYMEKLPTLLLDLHALKKEVSTYQIFFWILAKIFARASMDALAKLKELQFYG